MSPYLLVAHIFFGSISLLSIICALSSKKGGKLHRLSGKSYVISMLLALLSAVALSVLTDNLFLFLIAIFSGYFVYTGWRLVANRDHRFTVIDKVVVLLMLSGAIGMIAFGMVMYLQEQKLTVVIIVFGLIGGGFALVDANRLRTTHNSQGEISGWPIGRERIVLHVTRIGGASISTITAVFVVNIETNPEYLAWLLPTAIAVPIISYWVKRIRTVGL